LHLGLRQEADLGPRDDDPTRLPGGEAHLLH
jgi:hypothetical protein